MFLLQPDVQGAVIRRAASALKPGGRYDTGRHHATAK
jgi:hypothetical protein